MINRNQEKIVNKIFRIGLVFKVIIAILQIVSGILLLLVNNNVISMSVASLTHEELTEDPRDYIATQILQFGTQFLPDAKLVIALYLLVHGGIKLYLLYGLWKNKLKTYLLSVAVFSAFLVYQLYKYQLNHSPWLLALNIFDAFYIGLILYEYFALRKNN